MNPLNGISPTQRGQDGRMRTTQATSFAMCRTPFDRHCGSRHLNTFVAVAWKAASTARPCDSCNCNCSRSIVELG
eukprot:6897923-Pyramimonas_sp.AAC.1